MSAFLYGIYIGFKIDIRNKGMLLTYYLIPIIFAAFMGGIFTSINPESVSTITQTLVIFGVSMGAFLGTPLPLLELFSIISIIMRLRNILLFNWLNNSDEMVSYLNSEKSI